MGCPARANSDSFRQAVQLSVVCEQDDAACLLARTLKRHRVVAVNHSSGWYLSLEAEKLRNELDLAVKATALHIA